MALNMLGMGLILTAKDLASGTIRNLASSFSGMDRAALQASRSYQRAVSIFSAGIAIMMAGASMLGGAFALAGVAGEFEQGLARVGAVAQATQQEMRLLHDESLKIATDLGVAPKEAAEGLENLASQGFNARQSLKLLTPAIYLAQGGQISLASSTATLSAAMHVFGLNVDEGALAVDKMLAVSNQTALSAKDLELAIGTVGRGASITSQNLDEMLISMGLVKNTGVDASVAAQSVSSALVFMAGKADKFKELGVSVTDSTGKFRDFLDIVTDTAGVLEHKYTDQAHKAKVATELFSRFGLQAYSAIVQQLGNGIKNETTGAMLHGAAAVKYLREEMAKAAGTAEKFRDRMLDTFEGQKAMLGSSMETLAVVLGEPFAKAFKPIVKTMVEGVKSLVGFITSIPEEVKGPLFKAIVIFGALVTGIGAAVAAVGAFLVLKPFLLSMVVAFKGIVVALLPVLLYLGLIVGAVLAFRYAVQQNLGGIGDAWTRFSESVGMAVRGIIQLFTQGGFSGAVQEWFSRAENSGLKRFVITLYQVGYRVVQFFRGVKIGITTGLEAAAPAFERLKNALLQIGEALGLVGAAGPRLLAGIPSEEFATKGAKVGLIISKVIEWVVNAATAVASMVGGIIDGFGASFGFFLPTLGTVGDMLSWLGGLFVDLLKQIGVTTEFSNEGVSGWRLFGQVIGWVAGVVGGVLVRAFQVVGFAIGGLIMLVEGLVIAFKYVAGFIFRVGEAIGSVIMGVVNLVANLIDGVIVSLGTLASKIPASIRPAWADSLAEANTNARGRINRRVDQDVANFSHVFGDSVYPGAVEAESNAKDRRTQSEAIGRVATMVGEQRKDRERTPFNISVQVDGRELAKAVGEAQEEEANASFMPTGFTPVGGLP